MASYDSYPTGEAVSEAFCRTLRTDYKPSPPRDHKTESWFNAMLAFDRDVLDNMTDEDVNRHIATNNNMDYHSAACMFMNKRALFTTAEGYIGTNPARSTPDGAKNLALPGDKIAVFAGLEMPVILRPVDEGNGLTFHYVCHAYVHGIMYGEAWDKVGDELETIVLI